MKKFNQEEKEFMDELKALLNKYDAYTGINTDEHGRASLYIERSYCFSTPIEERFVIELDEHDLYTLV